MNRPSEAFKGYRSDGRCSHGTVSLTAKRAMWNTVRKAPVWVILAYGLGVLAVWGFIMIVMLKLRDIFTVGTALKKRSEAPGNETTTNN
jgi:hypothetical protein